MDKKQTGGEKKQLTSLKNNEDFKGAFSKIVTNDLQIEEKDQEFILSCAIILFHHYNNDSRYLSYFKLGYYIVLKYSLLFKNYQPLYDISLQIGFYPVSDLLVRNNLVEVSAIDHALLNTAISKRYLSFENYIETLEQNLSSKNILKNLGQDIAFIAPTSYGKSSLIKEIIQKNDYPKIGIIVPTKSLLVQTYNDIKKLNLDYKLILHDEMYAGENKFIGILTQERATRLITKHQIVFDIIFIDEAHKLLERDTRSFILSRLIQLNYSLNSNQQLVYLSPLVDDTSNIQILRTKNQNLYTRKIRHDLKVMDLYLYEKFESYIYDRFTGDFYNLNKKTNFFDYIIANSNTKNFIYHNRPKLIEDLAISLGNKLTNVEMSEQISTVIKTLKEEVHNSFYLVNLIEKGVVYLHGKIPNVVKEYLEYKFKSIPQLTYVIANNVILEGINLPIDTLFITSTYRLLGKDLTNLIGRVNRLNYVFQRDNVNMLVSNIHFMNSEKYQGENDIKNKMKLLRDHSFDDVIENPLLEHYDIDKLTLPPEAKEKRAKENVTLIEASDAMLNYDDTDLKSLIKRYLVQNSIDEYYHDLTQVVDFLHSQITTFSSANNRKIVNIVSDFFVISIEENIKDFEIERLKNERAVNYYNNFLDITQKQSLKEKITATVNYFKIKRVSDDPQLYIGASYGEEIRYSEIYKNNEFSRAVYVNLNNASDVKLVNWAIVKIKMEEDFVSYKLNKLITFLYDFNIISDSYYFNYVYGTDDLKLIQLVRFGLNVSIVKNLEADGQLQNLSFDNNGNLIQNEVFADYLLTKSELFKFELNKFLNIN